jgi:hypothetical protein
MSEQLQKERSSVFEWFMNYDFYKKYLLPGFVLQSVVIAGGYGTGRELVEYFMQYGPKNGLLGMFLVTTVLWAAVCATSFEFARLFRTYDYRSFFKHLIGGVGLFMRYVTSYCSLSFLECVELPQAVFERYIQHTTSIWSRSILAANRSSDILGKSRYSGRPILVVLRSLSRLYYFFDCGINEARWKYF